MFHVSTKQRLAALRRKYGIQLTAPKWARERSRKFKEAAAAMKAARDEARRQIVAALTPAPMAEMTPAGMFAMAGGPGGTGDSPTTVADAPYPSQHLSATDANRSRSSGGGGGSGGGDGEPGGSKRWLWILLLVAIALGLFAWCGLSGKKEQAEKAPAPAPVQAVAPAPEPPPPPPPPPPPAPKQLRVVKGDCLWRLSAAHLGDAEGWRRLYEANRDKIRNPDLIYPGQVFELP